MGDKGDDDFDMLEESLDEKPSKSPRPFQDDTASNKRQKTCTNDASQPHSNNATPTIPNTFIFPPIREHKSTIIFLHDKDTTPETCSASFFQSGIAAGHNLRQSLPNVKWIFPSSGRRDSTWFEQQQPLTANRHDSSLVDQQHIVTEPLSETRLHHAGVCASLGPLFDLIDAEVGAVGSDRVALAGLGQGCAMAAVAFLTGWHAVDNFVGLAGWLPCQEQLEQIIRASGDVVEAQRRMRDFFPPGREGMPHWYGSLGKSVLLLECGDDEFVPSTRSTGLYKVMNDMSMQVQRRFYNMGGHDGVTESRAMAEVAHFWAFWDMEQEDKYKRWESRKPPLEGFDAQHGGETIDWF